MKNENHNWIQGDTFLYKGRTYHFSGIIPKDGYHVRDKYNDSLEILPFFTEPEWERITPSIASMNNTTQTKTPDPLICSTIHHVINMSDVDDILSKETKLRMSHELAMFVINAVDKFIAGQKEHGGNLEHRDLSQEISNELLDLFWYHSYNKRS